jgi:hypothetical protein
VPIVGEEELMTENKAFILWDPKDGDPPREEDGGFRTSGLVGVIGKDNVYFKAYAHYPSEKRPEDLEHVGTRIQGVTFRLSCEKGIYDVYRVR